MWDKKKRTIALVVILGLVLALLVACAGGEKEATPTAGAGVTPAAGEPVYGGVLRYNAGSADPPIWDFRKTVSYATMTHSSYVHGKLLTFPFGPDEDPADFTPRASLAESWDMPNDLTIIFHLRKGVKWQNKPPVNGREFVAEDVKYTFDSLVSLKSPNLWQFAAIKSVECPDKYTVQMNLSEPFAPLFTNLADAFAWIFPREVDEQYGGMERAENVVGLGPWMVQSYQPSVGTVFVRNPDYWGKDKQGRQLPFIEEVRSPQVPDASTSLAAFRAGNFDVTLSVSREDWDSVKASNPELIWTKDWVSIGMTYLYFNVSQPPFNDVRVRRAISLAYDRDTWVATINYGAGARDNGPIPVGQREWHIPEDQLGDAGQWLKYDPEKARQLLAEAGYPNGFSVDLHSTGAYGTTLVENGELVVDMLSKVGIKATLRLKEYGAYLSTTFVGKFDGIAWGPQATFMDPDP
ncbi:MAG: hypothetical protein A2Y60_04930, partial [Chloroflexi bacterium RBG_13_54_9]